MCCIIFIDVTDCFLHRIHQFDGEDIIQIFFPPVFLYGSYHNIENITSKSANRHRYTIVGTACESTDVFDENITLPETKRGDLLTIKSAGAYGMSMASRYNLHDLPAAVYSDEL